MLDPHARELLDGTPIAHLATILPMARHTRSPCGSGPAATTLPS